ncbi:MAG TPA: hypothetical protein VJT15_15800 [Pyrinomonadaceae bacterium]|nr:hypothetical protein [Pyrinomonadaceae bacterium]
MPDHPSTDNRENPLDADDWDVAFEPFADHPYAALNLAYHLATLKQLLSGKIADIPEAIAAIDRAIDRLYEHSEFRNAGHSLFRQTVEGALTAKAEKVVHKLGIRT